MRRSLGLAAAFLLCAAAGSASPFSQNEIRVASVKDELRVVRTTLKRGSENRKAFGAAVSRAFEGEPGQAKDAEDYDTLAAELEERALAVERRLDAAIARNTPENAESVAEATEALTKVARTLRSDFELYTRLPGRALGEERPAALATMRFLSQTGSFPMALAYYRSRLPERRPFTPLPAGYLPSVPAPALAR
jgi:hypothetical protein